ncbi:hypothetical protein Tco_0788862, partial [Tanacetum coccineum]
MMVAMVIYKKLQQSGEIAQEEEAGIQSTQKEFKFMAATDAYKETKRVKVNCTSKDTLQQASTSGTQSDNAPYTDLQTELNRSKEKLENCIIKKEKEYAVRWNNYERLQAQLGDLKGKSSDTQCASNTLDPLSQKPKDDNVSLESQRVNNTAKTRRLHPKSSCLSNNVEKIEENHRNSKIPKNQNHMSSECNNITLAIRNAKSENVYVMCKQCLVTANHDVCVLNYVNDMNSHADNQTANVPIRENQKKHKANARNRKELGFTGSLASSRPSKPKTCLGSLKICPLENPNHLNEPNEAIPKVNPVVPKPNQVVDIHDPNEMVNIPDHIDLVDYDEKDPEEEPEEEPEEDVDIELEDDAELIFSYKVEGDKTPPPGDVSSDSVSSDSESGDEGLFKVGESSSAHDSSHVDGLAPWALRRDLEASRAQARGYDEAEFGYDVGNSESGENATLKKRLAETETKLVWARMEPVVLEPVVLKPVVLEPVVLEPVGKDTVKFTTALTQGPQLTWWNGRIASMGIDAANGTPWTEPEQVKVEQYIRGLSKDICGDMTSSRPTGIDEAV